VYERDGATADNSKELHPNFGEPVREQRRTTDFTNPVVFRIAAVAPGRRRFPFAIVREAPRYSPVVPSRSSRVASAWPAWRAVSLIKCGSTQRRSVPSSRRQGSASERMARTAALVAATRARYAATAATTVSSAPGHMYYGPGGEVMKKFNTRDAGPSARNAVSFGVLARGVRCSGPSGGGPK
jgi:hypothetical protein